MSTINKMFTDKDMLCLLYNPFIAVSYFTTMITNPIHKLLTRYADKEKAVETI